MIYFVTALIEEARPLIAEFAMRGTGRPGPWRHYVGEEAQVVVSGIGTLRSALATQWLAQNRVPDSAVLNIGCCGAADPSFAIGDPILIHSIRDHSSGRSHYPDVLLGHRFAESAIESWGRGVSQEDSPSTPLVDMEAFGFYQAASLYWQTHRIALLKVVSDHLKPERCKPETIQRLIADRIAEIATYARGMLTLPLSSRSPLDADLEDRIEQVVEVLRLTESQRHQLREATIACAVRNPKKLVCLAAPEEPPNHKQERARQLKALLAQLQT